MRYPECVQSLADIPAPTEEGIREGRPQPPCAIAFQKMAEEEQLKPQMIGGSGAPPGHDRETGAPVGPLGSLGLDAVEHRFLIEKERCIGRRHLEHNSAVLERRLIGRHRFADILQAGQECQTLQHPGVWLQQPGCAKEAEEMAGVGGSLPLSPSLETEGRGIYAGVVLASNP